MANYFDGEYSVDTHGNKNTEAANDRPAFHDRLRYNHYFCKSLEEFTEKSGRGRPSSPGKLSVDDFHRRDHNELKNDPIMDKYIPAVQERLKQRFGS